MSQDLPPYVTPNWFTSRVVNPLLMRFGRVPGVAGRGRTSGQWRTVPVNVLELEGQRHLMAPRGETQWARNLRATGRGEIRWRSRTEAFPANEVPDHEKPRVIEASLARWGLPREALFRRVAGSSRSPGVPYRAAVGGRRRRRSLRAFDGLPRRGPIGDPIARAL